MPFLCAYSKLNKGRRLQSGNGFDIQKWIAKKGIEFQQPGYNFLGPGTHLDKRLRMGQRGVNRLVEIARTHDIDYRDAGSNIKKKNGRLMIR